MTSGAWVTRAAKRALELVVPVCLADLEQHPTQPVGLAALVRAVLPQGKVSCRNGALVSFCIVIRDCIQRLLCADCLSRRRCVHARRHLTMGVVKGEDVSARRA